MKTTLADQQAALDVAASLARTHGHLPAAHIRTTAIFRDQVDISLHDSLADFEAWREGLGIDPTAVDHALYADGQMYLQARTAFLGLTVEITGYGKLALGGSVCAPVASSP
ncbi:hypothetical protein [Streptomyces monomycini]|uniref:hypothetical protein n=1 Tax=Streptomyces monomycini TaxID=371720 RepID=UPI00067C41C7|nr:hypothetical protein [Streptomyces monomycini]